jgi:hypothetical protein
MPALESGWVRGVRRAAIAAISLALLALPATARAQAEPGELDRALGVVLRSGCAEGLPRLTALADRTDLPPDDRAMARRVAGLCQNILADRARSGAPPPGEVDRSGRGKLVFGGVLYGIWAGVALDIMADIDDGRALVIPPLIGGAAGLAISLLTTREGEITNAQAWARITGFDYGTYSGLIWGAAADGDEEVVVGTALATGLAGGITAILLTRNRHPLQGDVELVRSGGLWGFATGGLLAAVVQPDQSRSVFTMMGLGMDGGLAVGLTLANVYDLPRNRVLFMDTGALGGGLLGFAAAYLTIGSPDNDRDSRILAGSALVGLYAGMGTALYLTRNMAPDRHDARGDMPGLVTRDLSGRWRLGRPSLLPWIDQEGHLTGALAPILAGAW